MELTKTGTNFQAIKTKVLHFPSNQVEIKSRTKPHGIKPTLDAAIPPLYAFRFMTPSLIKDHHSPQDNSSRDRVRNVNSINNDKQLPPVELSINKKVKFPHKQQQVTARDRNGTGKSITSSDLKVIQSLRHHLRTQPRNGTTSVLEAIGDPRAREERFYYEPLANLRNTEDSASKKKLIGGLRVVNIMLPVLASDQHGTGADFTLPLDIPSEKTTNGNGRCKGDTSVKGFSFLPSVIGNSLPKKKTKKEQSKNEHEKSTVCQFSDLDSGMSHFPMDIYPESKFINKSMYLPGKSPINLPRMGKNQDDEDGKKISIHADVDQNAFQRRTATTIELPIHNNKQAIVNGFPKRCAFTTATGKSHLIGPANKMDIIAFYNKAMRDGLISYDEYIKKISKLSLTKVALPNSSMRHFQIVRDKNHDMKPRLAHVDVSPISVPQTSPVENLSNSNLTNLFRPVPTSDRGTGNQTTSRNSRQYTSGNKLNEPTFLHRIDIGQELHSSSVTVDNYNSAAELMTTDLRRYSHVHHPHLSKHSNQQYHWNHEAAVFMPGLNKNMTSLNSLPQPGSNHKSVIKANKEIETKYWSTGNHESFTPEGLPTSVELPQELTPRPLGKVLRQEKNVAFINETKALQQFNEAFSEFEFDSVQRINQNNALTGNIPKFTYGEELMSNDHKDLVEAQDILQSITNGVNKQERSSPLTESVFQPHLANMFKTIRKAKRVSETQGFFPTNITQQLTSTITEKTTKKVSTENEDRNLV